MADNTTSDLGYKYVDPRCDAEEPGYREGRLLRLVGLGRHG